MISDKKEIRQWLNARKDLSLDENIFPESIKTAIKENNGFVRPANVDRDLLKDIFIEELTRLQPEFKIDEFCDPVIESLIRYICGDPELSAKKGLLLMGGVGSGKTLLMRGLNALLRLFKDSRYSYFPGFSEVPSYAIAAEFAKNGYEVFDRGIPNGESMFFISLLNRDLFVDDLGVEDQVTNFGNTCNVISALLTRRYDCGKRTHTTTNLDSADLKQTYGDRTYSRMKEMFNKIYLKGDDRRH